MTGTVPGWGPAAFPWQEHPPRGSGSPRLGAGGSAQQGEPVPCVGSGYTPCPPAHSPSPSTPQPPCSPLAPHLGRADGSRGAADVLDPALQEAALCPEGTRGRGGVPWGGAWVPANSVLLPRAWSCASTPRAAGCPWRRSTAQPSWYGCWGGGEGIFLGCESRGGSIPGLQPCPGV